MCVSCLVQRWLAFDLPVGRFTVAGRELMKIGDTTVGYDAGFRFYMTTKLTNPVFSPAVCVKVNLLNFVATPEGLQDQILGMVVNAEVPELERQRIELLQQGAANTRQLKEVEDTVCAGGVLRGAPEPSHPLCAASDPVAVE